MCLAIPMKLVERNGIQGVVELGGVRRNVDLTLLEGAKVGQYVIVHAGFGLTVVDEDEALKTLAIFEELEKKAEALS